MPENLDIDFGKDFIIVDKGRNQEEKTIVLIEDGVYKGFGYADQNDSFNNATTLKEVIASYDHNPETFRIIKHFMHTNNKEIKIIGI